MVIEAVTFREMIHFLARHNLVASFAFSLSLWINVARYSVTTDISPHSPIGVAQHLSHEDPKSNSNGSQDTLIGDKPQCGYVALGQMMLRSRVHTDGVNNELQYNSYSTVQPHRSLSVPRQLFVSLFQKSKVVF